MAISVFPAPSAAATSSAFAAELAAKNVTYEQINNFEPGVYTVTCAPTSSNVSISFVNATSVLSNTVTASGTVAITLTSAATKVYLTLFNSASTLPTIVTITKTASILTPDDIGNGTLDTINATGTYNETGTLAVLAIGGGMHGTLGNITNYRGEPGGRAGFINGGVVTTTAATTVTVGAKGVARNTHDGSDVAATNSSFGNLITTNVASNAWVNGNGGAGGYSTNVAAAVGNASQTFFSWNANSTTGGGGGGSAMQTKNIFRAGGGSGIGTGGTGGGNTTGGNTSAATTATTDATGKGAGGGGGGGSGTSPASPNATGRIAGDGSDGVIYVLRGF